MKNGVVKMQVIFFPSFLVNVQLSTNGTATYEKETEVFHAFKIQLIRLRIEKWRGNVTAR